MNDEVSSTYVDGSYLFGAIDQVRLDHPELAKSKLNIQKLSDYITDEYASNFGSSLRVTYYVKNKDPRIGTHLTIPDRHRTTGHWQIKQCGVSLGRAIPQSELNKLSEKYRDIFPRAEKGLDMELACDSLLLAVQGRVACFVFMFNDRDYIPLLQALQRLGANTYMIGLDIRRPIQKNIIELADRYLTLESNLYDIFDYTPPVAEGS